MVYAEKKAIPKYYEKTVELTLEEGGLVSVVNENPIGYLHNVCIEKVAADLAAEAGFKQKEKVKVYLRVDAKENKVNPPKMQTLDSPSTFISDWA